MAPLLVGYIGVAILFLFLFAGLPVGVGMGLIGVGGMLLAVGPAFAVGQLSTLPFAVTSNYAYAVLPLFVLMGTMTEAAGVTAQLFEAADLWLRRVRGGLYYAVVAGSTVFAAMCGSTIVGAVVFARIAFPEMMRRGYSRPLALGSIAATGSFSAMIPPSITMVIYAIITEQSLGRLLIAGIVPGLVTAAVYLLGIAVFIRLRPALAPPRQTPVPLAARLDATRWLWPIAILIVAVLGGIYLGLFPPSAAGAIGVSGTFMILLVKRRGRLDRKFIDLLADAAAVSAILFVILIGGLLFARMLVVVGMIDNVVGAIGLLAQSPLSLLLAISILYLILGCFLDTTSMMVVTLPFIFPAVQHFQIDPIWFGIILVKLVEISVLTPPVSLNLFAVMSVVGPQVPFSDIVRGVIPFICFELVVLGLLILFPELSTWLPNAMLGH